MDSQTKVKIWKKINKVLSIPDELVDHIGGNKNKKVSVILTESNEIIVTRSLHRHKIKYHVDIGKRGDFIPTAILKKAGLAETSEFTVILKDDELLIIGRVLNFSKSEKEILKPRILDL